MKLITPILAALMLFAVQARAQQQFTSTAPGAPSRTSSWLAFPGGTAIVFSRATAETTNPTGVAGTLSNFQCSTQGALLGYFDYHVEKNGTWDPGFPSCTIGPGGNSCVNNLDPLHIVATDKLDLWLQPGGLGGGDALTCTATFTAD